MSLIVHGRTTSSNVQAVMWGAAELGLVADRRDVGGAFGGNVAALTGRAAYRTHVMVDYSSLQGRTVN